MTDPILVFLSANTVALLLLGGLGPLIPGRAVGFVIAGSSGLGALLCLPPLLLAYTPAVWELSIGPPGLSLRLALDPIAAFFLFVVLLSGTAVAAYAAISQPRIDKRGLGASIPTKSLEVSAVSLCLAAFSLVVLAADAVTLVIGLTLANVALSFGGDPRSSAVTRIPITVPVAVLLLVAICLLAPSGFGPSFDAIRTAPLDPGRASAAAALTVAGGLCLLRPFARRGWAADALVAGAVVPGTTYMLSRLVMDLPAAAMQPWWGFVLLLVGGVVSVTCGWQAARHRDLDGSVACLVQRQSGLGVVGIGLTLIARSADLPEAACFGLAATLLLTMVGGVAGTLANLAAHALGQGAGTWRLARLGGLIRPMPIAAVALSTGLFALSALPPSAGFAVLWLLFQTILSAPRTGGLITQLPLALIAAALALSSALATVASVRLIGIVLLSRPRSVRGSAAVEVAAGLRLILLTLATIAILLGALPGVALQILADPVVRSLSTTDLSTRVGWATLSTATAAPGYSPLPVSALMALAVGTVVLIVRRMRSEPRISSVWNDGLARMADLPFGDPVTQSNGTGFLPALLPEPPPADTLTPGPPADDKTDPNPAPTPSRFWLRRLYGVQAAGTRPMPSAVLGLWALLLAFSVLLLMLAMSEAGGLHG